jgi:hypothetical protein
MQTVHRQHQRDNRENGKRHNRTENCGKGAIDGQASEQRQQQRTIILT